MNSYRVTKSIDFCYGHRLLNYPGKCAHLHGHNARLEVDVDAQELDSLGMVIDFSKIKNLVKGWVDATLDHTMLLHRNDPVVEPLMALGERLYLMDENPTAENICKLIFDRAREDGLPVSEIRLWETPTSLARYGVS